VAAPAGPPVCPPDRVTSRQYAGQTVAQVFSEIRQPSGRAKVSVSPSRTRALLAKEAEVVFLALPHGVAAEFVPGRCSRRLPGELISAPTFRLRSADCYLEFYGREHPAPELLRQAVYGLPEVYPTAIRGAHLVAAPGCYPTSILLPLIPLLRAGLIQSEGIIAIP